MGNIECREAEPTRRPGQQIADDVIDADLKELVQPEGDDDHDDAEEYGPREIDMREVLEELHPGIVTRTVRLGNAGGAAVHRQTAQPGAERGRAPKREAAPRLTAPLQCFDRRGGGGKPPIGSLLVVSRG